MFAKFPPYHVEANFRRKTRSLRRLREKVPKINLKKQSLQVETAFLFPKHDFKYFQKILSEVERALLV